MFDMTVFKKKNEHFQSCDLITGFWNDPSRWAQRREDLCVRPCRHELFRPCGLMGWRVTVGEVTAAGARFPQTPSDWYLGSFGGERIPLTHCVLLSSFHVVLWESGRAMLSDDGCILLKILTGLFNTVTNIQ